MTSNRLQDMRWFIGRDGTGRAGRHGNATLIQAEHEHLAYKLEDIQAILDSKKT